MAKEKRKNLTLEEIASFVVEQSQDRCHNLAINIYKRIIAGRFSISGDKITTRVMWHGNLTWTEQIRLINELQVYGFYNIDIQSTPGLFFDGYRVFMQVGKEHSPNVPSNSDMIAFSDSVDATINDLLAGSAGDN